MNKAVSKILFSLFLVSSISACSNNDISDNKILDSVNTLNSDKVQSKFNRTAKKNLWSAQIEARRWDLSAEVVKVIANNVYEDGRGQWNYYFTSPFKNSALLIESNGLKRIVSKSFLGNEIREFNWNIDSDEAIVKSKEKGLETFPIIEMKLENFFSNPEWELRTYDGFFRVDANNGNLLLEKDNTEK